MLPPSISRIKFACTYLYTVVERGNVTIRCFAQELTTQWLWSGLDPEYTAPNTLILITSTYLFTFFNWRMRGRVTYMLVLLCGSQGFKPSTLRPLDGFALRVPEFNSSATPYKTVNLSASRQLDSWLCYLYLQHNTINCPNVGRGLARRPSQRLMYKT